MNRPTYPNYRPSGVEWLGDVPEHWEVKRLKTSTTCWVSNVDKVPAEDELPVRLCNYTDVYYNEHVTPDMGLMEPQQRQTRFGGLVFMSAMWLSPKTQKNGAILQCQRW